MKKPRRLFRSKRQASNLFEHQGNMVYDFGEDSTIHAAWAVPCGTGNLLGLIWQDHGGPVRGRIRYENEGRKQVWDIEIQPTLAETIRCARKTVTVFGSVMELYSGSQFSVYEKFGPMTTTERSRSTVELLFICGQ